ncbi:MAG: Mu transposase C-terminal domain-containing protein, partial [Deltaproteobacteria bacterium]|nr:Mu transposase C-terminal domain-containing protein [Deltaproteobacteria bacterium]
GGWVPTIEEANNIIAGWVNEYSKRPHRGLKGICPIDILETGLGPGIDEEELRHLMMSIDIKQVDRNGINFMGRNYYDESLYGLKERVTIKYDFEDLSKLYVYDLTGVRLICEATPLEPVHPMAKILGTKDDMASLKEGIKLKRSLKKGTESIARSYIDMAPELIEMPEKKAEGIEHGAKSKKTELPRSVAERIEAEASEMKVLEIKPKKKEPVYLSEPDRYEVLLERECKGEDLDLDDMTFMRYFENTGIYKSLESRFEFLRETYLLDDSISNESTI